MDDAYNQDELNKLTRWVSKQDTTWYIGTIADITEIINMLKAIAKEFNLVYDEEGLLNENY